MKSNAQSSKTIILDRANATAQLLNKATKTIVDKRPSNEAQRNIAEIISNKLKEKSHPLRNIGNTIQRVRIGGREYNTMEEEDLQAISTFISTCVNLGELMELMMAADVPTDVKISAKERLTYLDKVKEDDLKDAKSEITKLNKKLRKKEEQDLNPILNKVTPEALTYIHLFKEALSSLDKAIHNTYTNKNNEKYTDLILVYTAFSNLNNGDLTDDMAKSHLQNLKLDLKNRNLPSIAEIEAWTLLHEETENNGTDRFTVLEHIGAILHPFRDKIKSILPDAKLKFRGSLVRGLKGYPKQGIEVTLDKYDCDAFIEVSNQWWEDMRKLGNEKSWNEEETNFKMKPIRKYGNLDDLKIMISNRVMSADTDNMAEKYNTVLEQLKQIQGEIKKAISSSPDLKGYAKTDDGIDFDLYIRPVTNTESTYKEGNPYVRGQITERGYSILEQSLEVVHIAEFAPVLDEFKYSNSPDPAQKVLLAQSYVNNDGKAVGIKLPEYQAVVGKHGLYIENKDLFYSQQNVHNSKKILPSMHLDKEAIALQIEQEKNFKKPFYNSLFPMYGKRGFHNKNAS